MSNEKEKLTSSGKQANEESKQDHLAWYKPTDRLIDLTRCRTTRTSSWDFAQSEEWSSGEQVTFPRQPLDPKPETAATIMLSSDPANFLLRRILHLPKPDAMAQQLESAGTDQKALDHCPWCHISVEPESPGRTRCPSCSRIHHSQCWAEHGGCGIEGCRSAPK
jgi:hypothetical protein